MSVSRLEHMAGIGVDRMGNRADATGDASILRLENLDTDLRPPPGVEEATGLAAADDAANSYLPFLGADDLRRAVAARVSSDAGVEYDWNATTLVSAGGLNGILNVLLAILEPGDEVVMLDPIYIGLVNRVRLAGGVPVYARCDAVDGVWRLDHDSLREVVGPRTKAFLMMSPAIAEHMGDIARFRNGTLALRPKDVRLGVQPRMEPPDDQTYSASCCSFNRIGSVRQRTTCQREWRRLEPGGGGRACSGSGDQARTGPVSRVDGSA